jgi:hypothetical protein
VVATVLNWIGVWAGVGESDEGVDNGGDDGLLSEKSGPGGCRYVRISVSVGLAFLVCERVEVRVRVCGLRVAEMPRRRRSARSSRDNCWSVEMVRERDSRVEDARMGVDPL